MQSDIVNLAKSTMRSRGVLAAVTAAFLSAACSAGPILPGLADTATLAKAQPAGGGAVGQNEIDKAISYWGQEYAKHPHSLKASLSYARNLKAAGRKREAFQVVQSASLLHGDSRELASEYGRLALEFDQVEVAQKVLAMADDPAKPDWRLISARGTANAKQGKFAEAVPFFERALQISPGEPSVLNNLAMTHVANGEPAKAEVILRKVAAESSDPKVRQNLALVLSLQGKHTEAEGQAKTVLTADAASADASYMRRLVKATVVEPVKPQQAVERRPASPASPQSKPDAGEPMLSAEAIIAMATAQAHAKPKPKNGAQKASGHKIASTDRNSRRSSPAMRESKAANEVGSVAAPWGQAVAAR